MTDAYGLSAGVRQSAALVNTLRRAVAYAQQRSHRYVTLEHLLLALTEDPDATAVLQSVRADLTTLRGQAADVVNRHLSTLYAPGNTELRPSYKLERTLQMASEDAAKSPYGEVDGAFVIAALTSEGDSLAAKLLLQQGLGFNQAMSWLHANRTRPAPPSSSPPAQPAASPPPRQASSPAPPPLMPMPRPAQSETGSASADAKLEDMLTKARDLLEVEDRKLRTEPRFSPGAPPRQPGPVPAPQVPAPQVNGRNAPRAEPRLNGNSTAPPPLAADPFRNAPMSVGAGRAEPGFTGGPLPSLSSVLRPPPHPVRERKLRKALENVRVTDDEIVEVSEPQFTNPRRGEGSAVEQRLNVTPGKLVENIPRRMRVAVAEPVEVRISREETEALLQGLEGRGRPEKHDIVITRAMTVVLRAPDGGFIIESLAPETQWIFDRPQAIEIEEFGHWHWVVTPKQRGKRRLQLVVSAKSVDDNGIMGDTSLPEQVIEVRVRANYGRALGKMIRWAFLMVTGGLLTEFALKYLPHLLPSLF